MSKFAPIALFVFNRPEHTRQTLEALAQNQNAVKTELYVFSDGARDDRDAASVAAVRGIVKDIQGFACCTVVERTENLGLASSIISGVSSLLEAHETIIVLEDDLITSNQFINYMNDALEFYKSDANAFSVTGHTLPALYLKIPEDYAFDTYVGYRCSSWSWGTWRDRWEKVDWSMGYYDRFLQDINAQNAFARGGRDLIKLLRLQFEGRIDSWAIRFSYSHYQNDMYCIYPTKTLVTNIGLDNSGVHSHPDQRFVHPALQNDWRPQSFCPAQTIDSRISAGFKSAMEKSTPEIKRKRRTIAEHLARKRKSLMKRLHWLPLPFVTQKVNVDILFASTYQRRGDAALVAWRLFSGIRAVRPGAKFLSLYRDDHDDGVVGLDRSSYRGKFARYLKWWDHSASSAYSDRDGSNFVSPAVRPNPARIRLGQFLPSLVHLHSVVDGLLDIEELRQLDCPIVWTLHDAWAFTGGCHYTGNCEEFLHACGRCPQLGSDDPADQSRELMQRKLAAYDGLDLTIVTPSTWLASVARQSALFSGRRVEVIPNGLDTERFCPHDQSEARSRLGVSDKLPVVLFGASRMNDKRKGGDLVVEALKKLDFPCTLLTFGDQWRGVTIPPHISLHALGPLGDDDTLADAYSAADAYVCASREDNLPNTVAEALACGTPCVAFAVNGLPDMIEHEVNGWLASPFEPNSLADGIRWLVTHPQPNVLRAAARQKALADYKLEVVVEKYTTLYATLTRERKARNRI